VGLWDEEQQQKQEKKIRGTKNTPK